MVLARETPVSRRPVHQTSMTHPRRAPETAINRSRLARRDRYLLRLLYEHDVLTTTHLCNVGFATRRRANYRPAQL